MPDGIAVTVTAEDRAILEAVIADRMSPRKHVWRARIFAEHQGARVISTGTAKGGTRRPCDSRFYPS